MQGWRLGFLGIETIPPWLGEFEVDQFFRLSPAEIATVKTRRGNDMQLGLGLHIGFLRMSGRVLNSTELIHWRILAFLGAQLQIPAPRVASLRALYPRRWTLHEHQRLAKAQLGFRSLIEPAQRQLVGHLRQTRGAATDATELLIGARQWLYEHCYLIPNERYLLDICRAVLVDQEAKLVAEIDKIAPLARRKEWVAELTKAFPPQHGQSYLDWLKQSPRSRRGQGLAGAFERIHFLGQLKVDTIRLPAMPLVLVKAYAIRTSRLKLTRLTRLKPETQTIGLTCFLQLTLWRTTDEAIDAWLMRVSEVRRLALERSARVNDLDWQKRHASLLGRISVIAGADPTTWQNMLTGLLQEEQGIATLSRADRARSKLMEMSAQVRSLLRLMVRLPIELCSQSAWLNQALPLLRGAYLRPRPALAAETNLDFLPAFWRRSVTPADGGQKLRMLESATLLQLQRSLRNASAVVLTSLSYRERESLLIPRSAWTARRGAHLQLLDSSRSADGAIKDVVGKVSKAMVNLARAVRRGNVLISEQRGIELTEFAARSDPDLAAEEDAVHQVLASRLGAIELPRLMMEVDAQVRFSSTLLRRAPDNTDEIMAVYGALLAYGMGLDRIQVMRMIPSVSESRLRTMMRALEEEGRLAEANLSVLQFMRRHPVVAQWGDPGLASSDMMTVESSRRLWNARIDPRTGNYAIGTYTHVLDQWGIAYDQPIVLNRRQAGAAIEGVLLQRLVQIDRLAVDTHGYTDVAMGLARLLGFILCPRLAMLRERKLYVAADQYVPKSLRAVVVRISLKNLHAQWDELLRLAASIREGWCSPSQVLARFGSDAQGDPLYQAAVSFGRLVRTQYLCEYFVDRGFRDAIRRVLNHGESVHQLQRSIRPYAIGPKRGRSRDEQQAISGSLSLLSNLVMAWNTQKIQQLMDLPAHRRTDIQTDDIATVGPVATRHINFRGVLHFPLDEFAEPVLREPVRVPATP
ncbi:MAG: Tn3 family transposase [Sterolibacteriaceae bacterium]|nr:Tn3 family transposase [Sterolibacteriaceae bacterium]